MNNVLEVNINPLMMKTADNIPHIRANVGELNELALVSLIGSCHGRVGSHWRVLFQLFCVGLVSGLLLGRVAVLATGQLCAGACASLRTSADSCALYRHHLR